MTYEEAHFEVERIFAKAFSESPRSHVATEYAVAMLKVEAAGWLWELTELKRGLDGLSSRFEAISGLTKHVEVTETQDLPTA